MPSKICRAPRFMLSSDHKLSGLFQVPAIIAEPEQRANIHDSHLVHALVPESRDLAVARWKMLTLLFSRLQLHFFGRLQSRRFDTDAHQPSDCPARHETTHKWKKAVEAADNLDDTRIL